MTMRNSPVNRLEAHWPKPPLPEAEQYPDEASWTSTAKSWEANLEDFMADHPKLTVAAAAALGMVLGWMVKRR
jgi:ElaB/YqjD/DUF883 family membrane-anchored ribosome-binding protein